MDSAEAGISFFRVIIFFWLLNILEISKSDKFLYEELSKI